MAEKIVLEELMMVDPGICEPGSAVLRSHYHVRGGFSLFYSPDSGLVHVAKEVNGSMVTRSVHVSRVREMCIQQKTKPEVKSA